MTEDDLRRAMVAASYEIGGSLHLPPNTAAYVAHRLANTPAPAEADPVLERAKEMAWVQYTEAGGGHRKDAAALWHGFDSAAKNGWLAVARMSMEEK